MSMKSPHRCLRARPCSLLRCLDMTLQIFTRGCRRDNPRAYAYGFNPACYTPAKQPKKS